MITLKNLFKSFTFIIGIFFAIFIYKSVQDGFYYETLAIYFNEIGYFKLLISSLFYLMSHLLRALRVTVMLEQQNFSLSNLIGKQFYTNAINLIIPFKLGEIYRILEVNKLVKDFNKTFITIVAERSIDFFILFCGLFVSLMLEHYELIQLKYTVGIGIFFIVSVLFIYFVLPENIKSINLFLAKRHKGAYIISFLAASSRIYNVITSLREIFKKRYSTIVLLSLLIWLCEILGFLYVFSYISSVKLSLLLAFLVFLSSLIHSGAIGLGGFQLAFYIISTIDPNFKYLEMSYLYQVVVFGPALVIGISIYFYILYKNFILDRRPKLLQQL